MLAVIQTPMDHCHQTTKFTFCQYYYTASIGSKTTKFFDRQYSQLYGIERGFMTIVILSCQTHHMTV